MIRFKFTMKILLILILSLVPFFPCRAQPPANTNPAAPSASPADILWNDACSALDSRQYQDALRKFEEFAKRFLADPRAAEARVRMGICDYRMGGKTGRALETWNRAVNMELMQKRASPTLLLALDQLASHHRSEGKPEEWRKTIDQLAEFFPENLITLRELRLLAAEHMNKGEFAQAIAAYERLGKRLNAEDTQNFDLARAMTEGGADGSALVKSANERLEQNEQALASRLYEQALKRNLRDDEKYEAMTKLGWCLYLQDKHKEAESQWQQVIKNSAKGNEWAGQSRWHMIQLLAGPRAHPEQAIELCDLQAKEFAGSFRGRQAAFTKAWLYWVAKDWEKAQKAFGELALGYPEVMEHEPIRNYIRDCEEGMRVRR